MSKVNINIDSLTVDERLALIERLWDSLEDDNMGDNLTPGQKAEIDANIAEAEAHPESCLTWDEVVQRVRRRDA